MDMAVETASSQNMTLRRNRFGARADNNINIRLGIRIARLANTANLAIFQPDISLIDT